MIKSLHDLHARYDSDGTPIWYVPRSWADTQKEITERLEKLTEKLDNMSQTQLRVVELLRDVATSIKRSE